MTAISFLRLTCGRSGPWAALLCLLLSEPGFGGDLLLAGLLRRQVHEQNGALLVDTSSSCQMFIQAKRLVVCWQASPDRWERYWLSTTGQVGQIVVPGILLPESPPRRNVVTNYVIASDIQPRNATPEVRLLAIAMMSRELWDLSLAQGFLPPWGDDQYADALCTTPQAEFEESALPTLSSLEFRFNEPAWRLAAERWGGSRRSARQTQTPWPNEFVEARLTISDYAVYGSQRVAKTWLFQHYAAVVDTNAPTKHTTDLSANVTNNTFVTETVTFHLVSSTNIGVLSEVPDLSNEVVADFRTCNEKNRGAYSVVIGVPDLQTAYGKALSARRLHENDGRMRSVFGGHSGAPQVKHILLLACFVILSLFLPLMFRWKGKQEIQHTTT